MEEKTFTNLEEAPLPKDNFQEVATTCSNNNSNTGSYRRASQAYKEDKRRGSSAAMNLQDNIHSIRLKEVSQEPTGGPTDSFPSTASAGLSEPPSESMFNSNYVTGNDGKAEDDPRFMKYNNAMRRKSSFEYEDYKKQMYSKSTSP